MIFGEELEILIVRSMISRILGFSGCYWMIFGGELEIFICQNQDIQDFRIFRMLLNDFWWGVADFYLSESGYPGFEDLQGVIG